MAHRAGIPCRRPGLATRDDIPRLVQEWSDGSQEAFDRLVTLLYDDLRALAHAHLRHERAGHTLNTTALVHEAYVELARGAGPAWRGRPKFFAFLSRVMRHVLVDYARRRNAGKRGGDMVRVPLDAEDARTDPGVVELLALNEALEMLEARDAQLATIVECRFFGGLKEAEIAEALGVSERTVERGWKRARAYLYRLLSSEALKTE